MAVKEYTNTKLRGEQFGTVLTIWDAMAALDTGKPWASADYAEKQVQAYGTFGGAVTLEGSNDPRVETDPGNAVWTAVKDVDGNAISFTGAGGALIRDNYYYLRPRAAASVSAAVVSIAGKRVK